MIVNPLFCPPGGLFTSNIFERKGALDRDGGGGGGGGGGAYLI